MVLIGSLALLIGQGVQAAGDADAGKAVFDKMCGGCHKVGPDARNAFGPSLNGIIGRPAGQAEGYKYSPSMLNSGITWTPDKLAAFVEAPGDVVPGTNMRLWWFGGDEKMQNLLSYLQSHP